MLQPRSRPSGLNTTVRTPPKTARTAEQFDTTTKEERAAAAAPVAATGGQLGSTIATLGDPTEPGFWVKTPLVKSPMAGKVTYKANGKSVQVDLIPLDGAADGGSQISLAAMRLIEAPLTDLAELDVFAN